MTLAKVKEQDGMMLAKVKEQDGMMLAKVKEQDGMMLAKVKEQDEMMVAKVKEQDGMMLAKVKEQDGIMLANVKVPIIPTSAACCDNVQLTNAESSSYTFYNRQLLNRTASSKTQTPLVITRAHYALGLCVCVRLYVCVCVFVCGQKTRLFTSHRSKFATKVHFAASSLNL